MQTTQLQDLHYCFPAVSLVRAICGLSRPGLCLRLLRWRRMYGQHGVSTQIPRIHWDWMGPKIDVLCGIFSILISIFIFNFKQCVTADNYLMIVELFYSFKNKGLRCLLRSLILRTLHTMHLFSSLQIRPTHQTRSRGDGKCVESTGWWKRRGRGRGGGPGDCAE